MSSSKLAIVRSTIARWPMKPGSAFSPLRCIMSRRRSIGVEAVLDGVEAVLDGVKAGVHVGPHFAQEHESEIVGFTHDAMITATTS